MKIAKTLRVAAALWISALGVANAQAGREEVYSFKVPIHLSQLAPDLSVVILLCYSSGSWYQPTKVIPQAVFEFKITGGVLDTTVVARVQTIVHPQDVGRQATYTCTIGGRRATDPPKFSATLGPNEQAAAFRVTPALVPITQAFVW